MSANDNPTTKESDRQTDQVQQGMQESRQSLLDEVLHLAEAKFGGRKDAGDNTKTSDKPELHDQGQINKMDLPPGWVAGEPYHNVGGIGTRSFKEYHPPESPDSSLCFYYRGLPMDAQSGKNFHDILQKPPHTLSQEELASLGEVLRDKKDPKDFTMASARTENVNGKTVLVIEGRYKEIQQDTQEYFVDASGDGRAVQEIYYQAPKDDYPKYLKDARQSMKSIQWK
jgi:hypothetical protein